MRSWAYDHKIQPEIDFPREPIEPSELTASISHTPSEEDKVDMPGKEYDLENQPGLKYFHGPKGPSNSHDQNAQSNTTKTSEEKNWWQEDWGDKTDENEILFRGFHAEADPVPDSWRAGEMHESPQSRVEDGDRSEDTLHNLEKEYEAIEWSEVEKRNLEFSGHFELDGFFEGIIKGYV
jgi:hypothetical protein